MTKELQTCPDRNNLLGPWKFGNKMDRWETDRWSKNLIAVRTRHFVDYLWDVIKHKRQTTFLGPHNDVWLWDWGPPRTCSFCGSIHPEDAIRLVSDGWEVDATGKTYKRYLNPPGYNAAVEKMRQQIAWARVPDVPWSPVPPVKVYTSHFNEDQRDRFNRGLHRVLEAK